MPPRVGEGQVGKKVLSFGTATGFQCTLGDEDPDRPEVRAVPRADLPRPLCTVGHADGCPLDAPLEAPRASLAEPVCLGKGNSTDPYSEGVFHCLLRCPCFGAPECSAESQHPPQPTLF